MPTSAIAPSSPSLSRPIVSLAAHQRPLAIGLICIAFAALARIALEQVFGILLPFLFTFPAVIAATLFGGARAGWIALIGCQALSYAFVLPHWLHHHDPSQQIVTLALSSIGAGAAIWATDAFQQSSERLRLQCQDQVNTLSLLIAEMDHRTQNNFQIAASILGAQASAADDAQVRSVLDEAANRLISIASVYQSLSADRPGEDKVSLRDHLERICAALRASLLPCHVSLAFHGQEMVVPSSVALPIGLIVNEWITNAVKHAFDERGGGVAVSLAGDAGEIRVEVRDDGVGLVGNAMAGGGSRLIPSLVGTINGRTECRSECGTVRTVAFPRPRP